MVGTGTATSDQSAVASDCSVLFSACYSTVTTFFTTTKMSCSHQLYVLNSVNCNQSSLLSGKGDCFAVTTFFGRYDTFDSLNLSL